MPREKSHEVFHEWDGLADKWITDEESFDKDFPTKPFEPGRGYSSVAEWIIRVIFGLTVSGDSSRRGGTLPGYDIKNRDAYQMVQLSLAVELASKRLVECYADGKGIVHFYIIGQIRSNISGSHIFYKINTLTLSKPCDNVLVIGYDPPPKRYTGKPFDLFTFKNELQDGWSSTVDDAIKGDTDFGEYPIYHVWGETLGPKCGYYKEGYIEYGDTFFDNKSVLEHLNIVDPKKFDTVSTYIYKITVPWFEQASTQIRFSSTTSKFIELSGFGELENSTWRDSKKAYVPSLCVDKDAELGESVGKKLPRSNEKKFLGVKDVYIYGLKLKQIQLDKYIVDDDFVEGTANFLIDLDSGLNEPFRLTRGKDYIIVDDKGAEGFKRIVFSARINPDYKDKFGSSKKASVRISLNSIYDKTSKVRKVFTNPWEKEFQKGVLKDMVTVADNSAGGQPFGNLVTIFPINEGQSGYIVDKIIAVYEWDNPCVAVYDELNHVTKENLGKIKIMVYPMIVRDEQAPISWAHGGGAELLNPLEIIPDDEAKTVQDLSSTKYARAFTSLETGDIKITLPFLDEDQCQTVSSFVYDMQNEIINQTTYTCSPEAEPVLGETIDGKTINSITYSYQDSSQYLISVNAGPIWMGVSGWEDAVYKNKTERIQLEGIIIDVNINQVQCQVMINQLGIMDCINGSKEILEKGDRVAITIHNNPVAK